MTLNELIKLEQKNARDAYLVREWPWFDNLIAEVMTKSAKAVGELEIGKAPIQLMQDGVSMDFSFREGWNEAKAASIAALKTFLGEELHPDQ